MKKWSVIRCIEREICVPKYYDTYEEAYAEMYSMLVENIIDCDCGGEYLDEDTKIIHLYNAQNNTKFGIEATEMWSNVDDDYDEDGYRPPVYDKLVFVVEREDGWFPDGINYFGLSIPIVYDEPKESEADYTERPPIEYDDEIDHMFTINGKGDKW